MKLEVLEELVDACFDARIKNVEDIVEDVEGIRFSDNDNNYLYSYATLKIYKEI